MTTAGDEAPDLPEYRDNPFISRLPPVLVLEDALSALTDLPIYREEERRYSAHLRSHCILRLGRYFDPMERQLQLETRFAALLRQGYVGRNPNTTDYLHRLQNGYERVVRRDLQASCHPVESTASGFALIGCSGIGKSRSIERVLRLYPHVRLEIAASTVSAPKALRFCPVCHADALARWGERYWRRAHQLAGVPLCPDHATPLVESTVIVNPGHQQEFVAATAENCRLGVASASWSDDERRRTLLQEISVRSAALLTTPPSATMFEGLAARYRQALIGRNLATAGGRVDQDRLHAAFEAVFSPLRPDFPAVTKDRWLSAIVRKHRHAFHPLHHILFGLFLDRYPNESGGPMDVRETDSNGRRYARTRTPRFADRLHELVGEGRGLRATARALSVDPNTIRFHAERLGLTTPWRPRPHPSRPRKEPPGPAIRGRWLDAQLFEPEVTRKALAARLPAEHAWLYRHDRRWLDVHSPAPARRSPPGRRMDWESIDLDLAGALRRAAEELSRRIEPVRITLAELERQIARNGWIGRRRDKLAKTAAVLAEVTETVEAFQLRRIAWARDKIERSDPAVPVWKIRRLAGLPAQASAAVEHALDATHCCCRRNS